MPAALLVTTEMFGGSCPVQGCGTVQVFGAFTPKRHWYFRARGNAWSVEVGSLDPDFDGLISEDDTDLRVSGPYGSSYDAGHMLYEHAQKALTESLERWAAGERGEVACEIEW